MTVEGIELEAKQFFNQVAENWDNMCQHDQKTLNHFMQLAELGPGQAVLDVGSGTGVMIPNIYSQVGDTGRICAVDFSEKMIQVSERKHEYRNIHYLIGDIMEVELGRDSFDCVLCYSVFPHFSEKEKFIARMEPVLKNGGKLVICHSESRERINNLHKGAHDAVRKDHLPEAAEVAEMMRAAGLEVVHQLDGEIYFVMGRKPRQAFCAMLK